MALDTAGKIEYKKVSTEDGIRYQADPPVCNICKQEISRANIGWSYLEREKHIPGDYEFIVCTACTLIREGGQDLRSFVERHNL
jgi:hypothetical protein